MGAAFSFRLVRVRNAPEKIEVVRQAFQASIILVEVCAGDNSISRVLAKEKRLARTNAAGRFKKKVKDIA